MEHFSYKGEWENVYRVTHLKEYVSLKQHCIAVNCFITTALEHKAILKLKNNLYMLLRIS